MTNVGTYIAIVGSLLGVIVGAFLQSHFLRRNQKDTRIAEWRNTAYSDFLNTVAQVATAQRHGKRDAVLEQLARLSDAKSRICVYGDPAVIRAIAEFWGKGAPLQTEGEILAYTKVCLEIRKSVGVSSALRSPDISQLLFNIDVHDVKTPSQNKA